MRRPRQNCHRSKIRSVTTIGVWRHTEQTIPVTTREQIRANAQRSEAAMERIAAKQASEMQSYLKRRQVARKDRHNNYIKVLTEAALKHSTAKASMHTEKKNRQSQVPVGGRNKTRHSVDSPPNGDMKPSLHQ